MNWPWGKYSRISFNLWLKRDELYQAIKLKKVLKSKADSKVKFQPLLVMMKRTNKSFTGSNKEFQISFLQIF